MPRWQLTKTHCYHQLLKKKRDKATLLLAVATEEPKGKKYKTKRRHDMYALRYVQRPKQWRTHVQLYIASQPYLAYYFIVAIIISFCVILKSEPHEITDTCLMIRDKRVGFVCWTPIRHQIPDFAPFFFFDFICGMCEWVRALIRIYTSSSSASVLQKSSL